MSVKEICNFHGEPMGVFYGLISSATFGLIPLFTLPLLAVGVSVGTALVYRFGLATLTMLLILLCMGQKIAIPLRSALKIAGLSVLYMLAVLVFFQAFAYLPSGLVATIQFLYPVMVMLIMVVFFHERFNWQTGLAVCLAVAGVALLSLGDPEALAPANAHYEPGHIALGVLLSLLAGLANGLYFIGIKMARLPRINGLVMTFYVMLFGAALSLFNALLTQSLGWIPSGWGLVNAVLLALVTAVFSNLTLILAIRRIGPTLTSILGVMEPLTAVCVGIAIFSEPFTSQLALGIGLIIGAVLLALTKSRA